MSNSDLWPVNLQRTTEIEQRNMRVFELERYFAKYEFSARYLLSASDCESLALSDLLQMADEDSREMWDSLTLGYSESQGHPLLREEIFRLYDTISADNLVVAVPSECIYLAMHILLRKSDNIIHLFPAYQSLYEVARSSGCKPHPWMVEVQGGHWHLDIDALKEMITRRTRAIVLNFPHNPTGFIPDRKTFDSIIDLARQHELFVFSDEMYRFLEYDPAKRLPAVCDIYEGGVSLGGLSKAFSLPGLRIGWLASQHKGIIRNLLNMKDYTTICNNAPGEILAIMALRAKEAILKRNRQTIATNLLLAESFFEKHPDKFQWLPPQGGSIAFPKLLLDMPVLDFCEAAVQQENVMVLPGSVMDHEGNHFRIGLGRENFPEALAHFGQYLQKL